MTYIALVPGDSYIVGEREGAEQLSKDLARASAILYMQYMDETRSWSYALVKDDSRRAV
ncbi:hypothetical protein LCGC14_1603890 [marine sediment metagenome]|uniref:Uncharacterized protein n=1 Tax=marine sediment metagenome TaxID=412755 RepID=A0A0F9KR52_9ZZZZ